MQKIKYFREAYMENNPFLQVNMSIQWTQSKLRYDVVGNTMNFKMKQCTFQSQNLMDDP